MERVAGDEFAGQPRVAWLDVDACPLVLVGIEKHPLALAQEPVESARQVGEPAHLRDARDPLGLFLREFVSLPDSRHLAWLADEESFPVGRVGRIGREHEHALLLLDARQMEEIGGRHEPKRAVAVGGQDVSRMHDDDAALRQQAAQRVAVGSEDGRIDRSVAHAGIVRDKRTRRQDRLAVLLHDGQKRGHDVVYGPGQLRLRAQLLAQADQHERLDDRVPVQLYHVTLRGE